MSKPRISRSQNLALCVPLLICVVAGVGIGFGLTNTPQHATFVYITDELTEGPSHNETGATSTPQTSGRRSKQGVYRYAGVATSGKVCSQIGTDILAREGGSAVDAAIAAVLCVGVVNAHSSGIGGGHFMTIYLRESKTYVSINARETAAALASEDMFLKSNTSSTTGGLAIAVPGEIMGFYKAHRQFGKLPWRRLFQPTIKLCKDGVPVYGALASAIAGTESKGFLKEFPDLRKMVTNPETGGIVNEDDLRNYEATVSESLKMKLNGGLTIYTPRPPSSGVVLSYILNILDGYHFSKTSIHNTEEKILTYHRIIEAFKFAYAKRTDLADENFVPDVEQLVHNMTSRDFGNSIRQQITDNSTHNVSYYGPTFYDREKPGTAHVSVLAANGDAVSITTTINLHFGSKVVGSRTGIVFNDEMDDFSTPNTTNAFGVPASPANFIHPGKRPLSSMSPAVVVDREGHVVLVPGAAGGTQITTTVALVTIGTLWFGEDPERAIDSPRFHHQLMPDHVVYDNDLNKDVVEGLKNKGHDMRDEGVESNCNAILKRGGKVYACSDRRKGGSAPDGY